MSQETQILFELKDVESIQFKCTCGAALSLNPDGETYNAKTKASLVPQHCPQCNALWFNDNRKLLELLAAIKEIRGYTESPKIRFVLVRKSITAESKESS